ncbi:MAG TPA: hypothetical protein ENI56_01635 [Candidatus Kaiserbacteria bacterium]|nr:hypothetical protein [Candidatus Kaiserbacteria bacterium]
MKKHLTSRSHTRRTILLQVALIIGVAVSAIALQSYAAVVFVQPTQAPPNGNALAPINVGSHAQIKQGGLVLNAGGATNGLIVSKGNVGIGTMNPTSKLDVNGQINTNSVNGFTQNDGYDFTQLAQNGWGGSHAILFGAYRSPSQVSGGLSTVGNTKYKRNVGPYGYGAGSVMYFANGGAMDFYISPASTGTGTNVNWGTPIMSLNRNGNVGIGTASPSTKLDVNGKITSSQYCIGTSCVNNWSSLTSGLWAKSGNNISSTNSGNVGIGTTNPGVAFNEKLTVNGDIYAMGNELYLNSGGNYLSGDTAGYLRTNGGFLVNGNVGIGTTNPTSKLDVRGLLKTDYLNVGSTENVNNVNVGGTADINKRLFVRELLLDDASVSLSGFNTHNSPSLGIYNWAGELEITSFTPGLNGSWTNQYTLLLDKYGNLQVPNTGSVTTPKLCLNGQCRSSWASSGPQLVTFANFISTYGGHTASDPATRALKYYIDMSGNLWTGPVNLGGGKMKWQTKKCNLLHTGTCRYADDFWPSQSGISYVIGGSTDTRGFTIWDSPTKVKNCSNKIIWQGVFPITEFVCDWN